MPQPLAPQVAVPLSGGSQTVPQLPQFCVSASSLTQAPSQGSKPGSQVTPHRPSAQLGLPLAVDAQAVPQTPQFAGSESTFTHEPLQFVVPSGQLLRHVPLEQT